MKRLTRRQATAAAVAVVAPVSFSPSARLLAQTQPPPTPASPPADELTAARQQNERTATQLRAFKLPIATEPSVVFKP